MSRLTVYGGGLPSGALTGQALMQGANGPQWVAPWAAHIPPVGGIITTHGSAGATGTTGTAQGLNGSVNTLYLVPIYLVIPMTFSALSINCSNASAGAVVEIGLFTWTEGGTAETLLFDAGSVGLDTTGQKTITTTTPIVGPGWVGVGVKPSAAGVLISGFQVNSGTLPAGGTAAMSIQQLRSVAGAAGAFATSYTGLALTNLNGPWVALTRAS